MHDLQLRDYLRGDLDRLCEIEAEAFEYPWSREQFVGCLRYPTNDCVVAEDAGLVVGYVITTRECRCLALTNLAVAKACRRRGVGRRLVLTVADRLLASWKRTAKKNRRRRGLLAEVRETNLAAQRFFRANGFFARGLHHGVYEETGEDLIEFWRNVEPWRPRNRIEGFWNFMPKQENDRDHDDQQSHS